MNMFPCTNLLFTVSATLNFIQALVGLFPASRGLSRRDKLVVRDLCQQGSWPKGFTKRLLQDKMLVKTNKKSYLYLITSHVWRPFFPLWFFPQKLLEEQDVQRFQILSVRPSFRIEMVSSEHLLRNYFPYLPEHLSSVFSRLQYVCS